jgi:hypothetical protein
MGGYIRTCVNWQDISLFDYVENPWCLPGDIDVVYTVPRARTDVYRDQTCIGNAASWTYFTTGVP